MDVSLTQTSATQNVGAVTLGLPPAAAVDAPESTSAETVTPESQSAAVEGAEVVLVPDSEEEKPIETAEPETEVKDHKKTFEERLAEIKEEAKKEVLERIEAERQEREKQAVPVPFELDYTRIKSDFAKSFAREAEIKEELRLDPENADPELVNELFQIEQWRKGLTEEIKTHETKRAEILEAQKQEEQKTAYWNYQNQEIDRTLKTLQEIRKVPDEVITKGREVWKKMVGEDPLLQRKFDEGILAGRRTETVEWAWKLAEERLANESSAAIQKKEEGKDKQLAGDTSESAISINVKTWADLMKHDSKVINKFAKDHPKAFQRLKDQKFK